MIEGRKNKYWGKPDPPAAMPGSATAGVGAPEQTKAVVEQKPIRVNVRLMSPDQHPGQMQMCRTVCKHKIICAGRRSGKTSGSSILAVEAFLGQPGIAPKRVLYAAPTIDQVEKFWTEVKKALNEPLAYKLFYKNETKHIISGTPIHEGNDVELSHKGDPRIRAKTAFNAQSLRGDYADLLILDEYQMMDETALAEVGYPMLMDNNGDLVLIFTPPSLQSRSAIKAKDPMHAPKLFKEKRGDPEKGIPGDPDWLCIHFTSHDNPHINEEGIAQASKHMSRLAYRQEIMAEDIDEVPGALWKRKWLEDYRCAAYNPMQ